MKRTVMWFTIVETPGYIFFKASTSCLLPNLPLSLSLVPAAQPLGLKAEENRAEPLWTGQDPEGDETILSDTFIQAYYQYVETWYWSSLVPLKHPVYRRLKQKMSMCFISMWGVCKSNCAGLLTYWMWGPKNGLWSIDTLRTSF